ncbi:GNAT family N-acetyltransferase [Flagellimonas pacifica]|uniref:Acetyltransferase (GNAT) family protein n=1 Tax=Flagellimonas pacifica TaxID=1247520 RepID=A0A285MRP6_9FLAO|nr:GNAT family N-acetyltransferase [Allomuricauda parva]SNY99859.1 Acetyltransferase (GNAT) family protein [Allomuricauda parva]
MFKIDFIDQKDKQTIIPFLSKLDSSISVQTLNERLNDMFSNGYQCIGIYDDTKLIGISGLWILTKYYIGKHVEPDNVFILPEYQGKNLGKQLVEWIFDYAKSIDCEGSELNCYSKNEAGQKFWESQGYKVVGYHYQKKF